MGTLLLLLLPLLLLLLYEAKDSLSTKNFVELRSNDVGTTAGERGLIPGKVYFFQFDLWKTFFADLSTRHFPFLLEFDLYTAYFVEPPRAFFSSGDYSIVLSDDFDTV